MSNNTEGDVIYILLMVDHINNLTHGTGYVIFAEAAAAIFSVSLILSWTRVRGHLKQVQVWTLPRVLA